MKSLVIIDNETNTMTYAIEDLDKHYETKDDHQQSTDDLIQDALIMIAEQKK